MYPLLIDQNSLDFGTVFIKIYKAVVQSELLLCLLILLIPN